MTQRRFAELLRDAQAGYDVANLALAAMTGIDATTISRYRKPDYPSGPPAEPKRRMLERALGAPEGYLDGLVELSVEEMQNEARNGSGARHGLSPQRVASASAGYAEGRPPLGEKARKILELELELAVERGEQISQDQLRKWYQLALRSTTPTADEGHRAQG